jgi:hypothetical protein
MKKIFTFLLFSTYFLGQSQNADLSFDQTWVPGTIYTAVEPVGWISSNVVTAPLVSFPLPNTNAITVSQSTSAFVSSPNAARITTKKVAPGILSSFGFGDTTGFMITGKLVGLSAISFGYAYAVKSAQLDFQYNYQSPTTLDRGLVSVVFLKRNGANRDTIATGYTILNVSPSPTAFQTGTVIMNYKNLSGSAPDTAIIGAASSVGNVKTLLGSLNIVAPPAAINSTLILDDLSFSGLVTSVKTISEEKSLSVNFNTNSETLEIKVSNGYVGYTKIKIYDVTGKMIASKNIINNVHQLDVKEFQTGLYLYSVTDKSDRNLKSGKIVISK